MKSIISKHLQLSPLEKLLKELIKAERPNFTISKEASLQFRSCCEAVLINIFTKVNQITHASRRVTLMKRDLDAFCSIINLDNIRMKFANIQLK